MTQEELENKLNRLKLKKQDFAEISNMNKGTVYNWGTTRIINNKKSTIEVPSWVEPFLDNYEKAIKYEQIRKLLS